MPLTPSSCVMQTDLVIGNLAATSKRQALRQIAARTAGLFGGNEEDLLNALMDRERIGTTGIGGGVAIPHIKTAAVDRPYSVLVRLSSPVDYDAVDSAPVDIIFLLLAPSASKTTQYLKVLAQMSRFLKDPATCGAIRDTADESVISGIVARWLRDQTQALAS